MRRHSWVGVDQSKSRTLFVFERMTLIRSGNLMAYPYLPSTSVRTKTRCVASTRYAQTQFNWVVG